MSFGDSLAAAVRRTGSVTCVGLDPRKTQLPEPIVSAVVGDAPLPRIRRGPDEDPETNMNRMAKFVPNPVSQGGDAGRVSSVGGKTVRIVGPTYWGEKDAAKGLLLKTPGN